MYSYTVYPVMEWTDEGRSAVIRVSVSGNTGSPLTIVSTENGRTRFGI